MMGEECLNAFSLVCIHQNIFLDYNKIIDIYASKYPRRKLLVETVETFNISVIYAHFVTKENLIVLFSLLKD